MASAQSRGFDVSEYQELADLAREGLEVLTDASPERRATLIKIAAFADWLVGRTRAYKTNGRHTVKPYAPQASWPAVQPARCQMSDRTGQAETVR